MLRNGRKAATLAAAAAILVLSAGAASAYPAHATGSVNVRTGPGVGYYKVDTLVPGEWVDVQQCQGGWCFVSHAGRDGWVSANYLGQGGVRYPNRSNPSVSIQFNTPGFGFSFGTPQPAPWPQPRPWPYPRHHHYPWPNNWQP